MVESVSRQSGSDNLLDVDPDRVAVGRQQSSSTRQKPDSHGPCGRFEIDNGMERAAYDPSSGTVFFGRHRPTGAGTSSRWNRNPVRASASPRRLLPG